MSKDDTKKKPNDLDQLVELLHWLWLVLLGMWYFIVTMVHHTCLPGSRFTYGFQIIFAVMFIVIQFGALFWFLGRPR